MASLTCLDSAGMTDMTEDGLDLTLCTRIIIFKEAIMCSFTGSLRKQERLLKDQAQNLHNIPFSAFSLVKQVTSPAQIHHGRELRKDSNSAPLVLNSISVV